ALGTDPGSSWRSETPEDQTSPSPSSCATPNSATDVPDAELTFTVGVTEGTPYACQFCDKAFPRLSYLKKHEQASDIGYQTSGLVKVLKSICIDGEGTPYCHSKLAPKLQQREYEITVGNYNNEIKQNSVELKSLVKMALNMQQQITIAAWAITVFF
ncbi:hypothetical protein L9F63_016567, partial [Diploptera punctata]